MVRAAVSADPTPAVSFDVPSRSDCDTAQTTRRSSAANGSHRLLPHWRQVRNMPNIHVRLLAAIACLVVIPALYGASQIPERISDEDFWYMVSNFSEADGSFHSDNFVSNETMFQR